MTNQIDMSPNCNGNTSIHQPNLGPDDQILYNLLSKELQLDTRISWHYSGYQYNDRVWHQKDQVLWAYDNKYPTNASIYDAEDSIFVNPPLLSRPTNSWYDQPPTPPLTNRH